MGIKKRQRCATLPVDSRLKYYSPLIHNATQSLLSKGMGIIKISKISVLDNLLRAVTTSTGRLTVLTVFLTLLAGLLWTLSIPRIDPGAMTDIGLVSVLPLSSYAALLVLIVSFSLAIHQRELSVVMLVWHTVLLIFFIHGTPVLLHGTLRYSWAWKHVGIIDYIERYGGVNRTIETLNAYHNWPGFFSLNALITEVTGLKSPLSYAPWAHVFFNLLYLGTLPFVFRSFSSDRRLIWLGVWFFFLTNWVGQDYFSPQAMGYFLYLVVIGVCLRWFQAEKSSGSPRKGGLIAGWLRSLHGRLVRDPAPASAADAPTRPLQRAAFVVLVSLLMVAIVASHQLTPFMTIVALVALVLFRRISARSLPILMIVLTVTWLFHVATPFLEHNIDNMTATIGQLLDNVDSNLIDTSRASPGHRLVALAGRGLTVLLWSLAILGGIRRLRNRRWDPTAMLLAFSPFLMLGGNAYGGEILFRVYFFALPFMAFFAAALVFPIPGSAFSWRTKTLTILLSTVLLIGLLFAYYGKERQYNFTQNEVDAAQYVYSVAPPGSLLIEGSRNYPSQFRNYEYFTYVPISREPQGSRMNVINHPVETLSRWMRNSKYSEAYFIITRSMKAEVDAIGELPKGSLDKIEQALIGSQEFRVVFQNSNAKVFALAKTARREGQ